MAASRNAPDGTLAGGDRFTAVVVPEDAKGEPAPKNQIGTPYTTFS